MKLTRALQMAQIDEAESQPREDGQPDTDLPKLSPQERIEKFKIETPMSDFDRFYQWSSRYLGEDQQVRISNPSGDVVKSYIYWWRGLCPILLDRVVPDKMDSAPLRPGTGMTMAVVDNFGEAHILLHIGAVQGDFDEVEWLLCWAMKEKEYWLVFNYEVGDEDLDGRDWIITDPAKRVRRFHKEGPELSYCRLSGFNLDSLSGTMDKIYRGGFTTAEVVHQDGVLLAPDFLEDIDHYNPPPY
jgi:hypothetical protein